MSFLCVGRAYRQQSGDGGADIRGGFLEFLPRLSAGCVADFFFIQPNVRRNVKISFDVQLTHGPHPVGPGT